MLWDPGSVEKDEEKGPEKAPITPILVPLQNKPSTVEKSVPVLVPDVQDLKDQFQQQQSMLTQIKETLMQNETQLSSKGKQMEAYANKLSQIRARSKNSQGSKKATGAAVPSSPKMQKKSSKENLTRLEPSESEKSSHKHRKGKVSELKKCLEENKIKFEQRTGKELSETKKIESLVEQLKQQLEERDRTIHELQKNIEEPTPKLDSLAKFKPKPKDSVASKTTQTTQSQPTGDSSEIIALQNKILELEANVLDLEENLKEKESVIEARTQAVTLLSQDLSLKGKNTLESLEETRQEMRTMQNNFIAIEDQLKKDLIDRDSRLETLLEKCKRLESTNFELSLINAELQEKLVNLQTKYLEADAERKSLKELTVQGQPDDRLDELTKKINDLTKELDNRNKSMIKMKVEHKNKIKNLNKTLDTLKGTSDEKAEIVRLSNLLEEFESVKTGLENRVAELEDEKVSEKKLKDQINELEIIIQKQNEDLDFHLKTISNLEKDKLDLIQSNRDQNVLIENLQARIADLEAGEGKLKEMTEKMKRMEEEHNKRIEELKGDHWKEIEMLESYYNAKGDSLDKKALEEYRISTEINNIHVEEQIELLIREKQQLLEKLKSLSGVSSTDSLTFEKMEHSDLKDDKEISFPLGEEVDIPSQNVQVNRSFHLEKIVSDQQLLINDLQKSMSEEKEKVQTYQQKVSELEDAIKHLEEMNVAFKQQIDLSEATESGKNTKTSTNTKNRIKKIEMELTQSKRTVQEQSDKLKELGEKLQEKEELIKKYTEKIELFEKDDWDRQNHWKNTEDDIETVQELQKKCLSLENSLFELNEDCERLRKENIEVVHLLSEEKVKRRKLLEERDATPEATNAQEIETRIETMNRVIKELEERIEKLESNHRMGGTDSWEVAELQEKLEWTNVVLTSKETEMFRLQNLLEDRNNTIEMLEIGLKEYMTKLDEKEKKIGEMSENFDKLQRNINAVNEKSTTNEKLEELLTVIKETEGSLLKKEEELEEIKGILADKNLKMKHLRNRLEEVDSDLSYKERLENMEKSLREKESDYNVFLSEKAHLEEINRSLITEKEDILNQKLEISQERDELKNILLEKEKIVAELNEKVQKEGNGAQEKSQNIEDLKIKMKKLAANLKKKAQNEADLLKQVEELEAEVKDVTEKWTVEKMEKEKMSNELEEVKTSAGITKAALEKELETLRSAHEEQVGELGRQIQALQEACCRLEVIQQDDKEKMKVLEAKIAELENQNAALAASQNQHEIKQENQTLLQKLAETTGKYEEMKFRHDQVLLEKCETEKRLEEIMKTQEELSSEKSSLQAKIQENFAVIENLELELKKTLDQLKIVEEKFFYSEDRRLSLENKNEEMCKKIMENSENLITIDDLAIRVEELLKSEKTLQSFVKILESGNAELKQTLDQLQTEKHDLQKELKASGDKMAEIVGELSELKNSDGEKSNLIRELTKEVERLRAENKLISLEFQKLNQDYEQFENDFKENLENSQNVEKSLRHKLEELLNENVQLTEKCNLLSEVKPETKPVEEEKKPKKRKSVTFRTDETEYIKDLKNQLHSYDARLKEANEEIENLKAELFRERLRHEVTDVVTEAREKVVSLKSSPEKKDTVVEMGEESPTERKFDANTFFGNDEEPFLETKQSSEFDSLMWDDGWGAEGNLEAEYLSGKVENERMKTLEIEINSLEAENERLRKELQEQTAKYAKAIKKLKEVKTAHDKLQFEASKLKSSSGLGDLDEAIAEELKSQIESMEAKEKELLKNLENAKLEKDALLKRIDALNAGNEKFVEMKERQDNEVEIWQRKNNELLKDIAELRKKLENPVVLDDNAVMAENRELKNKVEALEWKNCELNELLEEQQELLEGNTQTDVVRVMEEKSQLRKEIEELNSVRERLEKKLFDEEKKNTMTIEELNEQLTALASENETLQGILGEIKKTADAPKQFKIIDYFKSSPGDVFPVNVPKQTESSEVLLRQKEEEIASVRQQLSEAENAIKLRDEQKLEKENEIICLRHSIVELENLIKLKEMENSKDQFETVDLNPNAEIESLSSRVVDLEGVLAQREDELQHLHQTKLKEMEELRERIFQLEDVVRCREDELNRITGNEMNVLKQKILELEELARFKETEVYQIQSASGNEIQNLNQKIFELENALRFKEDESRVGMAELENLLLIKDKEIERLANRVMDLEKSYNDSKQEIERLLNEENLNTEEKFVEPFQSNMKIPVAFEVEALSRTLNEEKQKSENLLYELSEKENLLTGKNDEVTSLSLKVSELKERLEEESNRTEESNRMKAHLERMISELQKELESSNFQLSVARRELEEFQSVKDEAMQNLKSQLFRLESELVESRERERTEVEGLKCELEERRKRHEEAMNERREGEEKARANLEREVELLRKELESKEKDVEGLSKVLAEERRKVEGMKMALEEREGEVADLKETLSHLQEEIGHFRNFEKQVKELRVAQIKEGGSEVNVTPEGHPDLSDWSEHELAELSTRLQSDLDTALYMLHQRDVRCDELTFELMQLLEERDTLQLRLSTALRINEELRAAKKQETTSTSQSLQESKDLVDQSNDRQGERGRVPSEDLRQLANKISELHSVSYLRDKTVKDDSVQRHKEQMNLLSRVSDSDISLSRDVQSSPAVLLNWMRGKTTPKVMHI